MAKTKIFWYLLGSIFLIVFNIYFFLLKGAKQEESVWISYISIHLAYFMLLTSPYFVRKGNRAIDYAEPLFTISSIYFIVSFVAGVTFIIIALPTFTVALLVQVTIAAIYFIILLINLIANEHTADNVERHEKELFFVKGASSTLSSVMNKLSDSLLKKKIEKVYDLIHSSPVKSSPAVFEIEHKIINSIFVLEENIQNGSHQNIELVISEIYKLTEERNRQLKLLN